MSIIGADIVTFVPSHFLKAHPDIGLDILHQVAQVNITVGVGQSTGDEDFARLGHGLPSVCYGPAEGVAVG